MTAFLIRWLVTAVAVLVAAQILDGVDYKTPTALAIAALLLGIVNAILRPVLLLLTLVFNVLAFGVAFSVLTFALVLLLINALLFWLVGVMVDDFHVGGFWAAFWGALIVSIASLCLNWLVGKKTKPNPPRTTLPSPNSNDDVIDV